MEGVVHEASIMLFTEAANDGCRYKPFYAESLLRKDLFMAMRRCQDSSVFEVGKG